VRGFAVLVRDEQERPMFLQGTAFDVTQIKEAEQRSQGARKLLEAAQNALPEGVVICDREGVVRHLNGQAARLLGAASGLTGQRLESVIGERDPAAAAALRNLLSAPRNPQGEAPPPADLVVDCGSASGPCPAQLRPLSAEAGGWLLLLRPPSPA
jgi:PAS domain-containing protein